MQVTVRESSSRVGGGAFPETELPTFVVCVTHRSMAPDALQTALLRAKPPVLARVEQDCLCFDPRTLCGKDFSDIADALRQAVR